MPVLHKPDRPNESSEAVNVYRTIAHCTREGCSGTFEADGYQKPLLTPLGPDPFGKQLIRHGCNQCGESKWFTSVYPRLHYIPATIPIEDQMRELMKERRAE